MKIPRGVPYKKAVDTTNDTVLVPKNVSPDFVTPPKRRRTRGGAGRKDAVKKRSSYEVVRENYLKKVKGIETGTEAKKIRLVEVRNPVQNLVDVDTVEPDGTRSDLTIPIQALTRKEYNAAIAFEAKALGVRQHFKNVDVEKLKLTLSRDNSSAASNLLCALLDPENRHLDPAAIAIRQRIPLHEVLQIWRSHEMAETMDAFTAAAPKVALDTATIAQNRMICCPRCDGAGQVQVDREAGPVWIECPQCDGVGKTPTSGDPKARELVLRATGIIKNQSGQGTHITINAGSSGVESVIDELEQLGPAITVRGEPINDES